MALLFGKYRRWVILILCIIDSIFMGGVQYGWNGLVPVWKNLGIFGCSSNSSSTQQNTSTATTTEDGESCGQAYLLSTAYIVSAFVQILLTFPCGLFFDRFHIRVTKFANGIIFLLACLVMGFVSPTLPWLIFVSGLLYALSGPLPLICNLRISVLFPNWSNFIVSIISGAYDASSIVFQIITFGYQRGIPLLVSFVILGVSGFTLMTFTAFCLFPRVYITDPPSTKKEIHEKIESETNTSTDNETVKEVSQASVLSVVLSRHYLLQLLWFSCILLRFQFFIAALQQHLEFRFPIESPISKRLFTTFGFFQFFGLLFPPVIGCLLDLLKKCMTPKGGEVTEEITLRAIGVGEFCCSTSALLLSALTFIEGETIFYVLFVLQIMNRSFLFGINGAFSVQYYPRETFGVLFGIMIAVGGIPCLLQFALLEVSIIWSNVFLTITCALSFIQPVNLIIGSRSLLPRKSHVYAMNPSANS